MTKYFICIFLIALTLLALYLGIDSTKYLIGGLRVKARIINIEMRINKAYNGTYGLHYTYTYSDNNNVSYNGENWNHIGNIYDNFVGQTIDIIYLKNCPSNSRVDSFKELYSGIIVSLILLVAALSGLLMVTRMR